VPYPARQAVPAMSGARGEVVVISRDATRLAAARPGSRQVAQPFTAAPLVHGDQLSGQWPPLTCSSSSCICCVSSWLCATLGREGRRKRVRTWACWRSSTRWGGREPGIGGCWRRRLLVWRS